MDAKLANWLSLSFTKGVGPVTALKLIGHFGSVEDIYKQTVLALSTIISPKIAELIICRDSAKDVKKVEKWLENDRCNQIITLGDAIYPEELATISAPPLVLFAKGKIELLKNTKFAIIGSRHPSAQGMENARIFAKELADNSLTIVSGLAAGIDRYAHLGALQGIGSTIGVIGTGIDIVYPSSNIDVYREVIEHGLILSEYPLGTTALSVNFPRRNRIIAGLSKGCLIVESALDGGSMISAGFALEMGREVMAIPGSIHNPVAKGCHKLIKQGAKLVETTNDILEELGSIITNSTINSPKIFDLVLDNMGYDPITIDNLCIKLNMNFADICAKLLELELENKIVNCGGGCYQRVFK